MITHISKIMAISIMIKYMKEQWPKYNYERIMAKA